MVIYGGDIAAPIKDGGGYPLELELSGERWGSLD